MGDQNVPFDECAAVLELKESVLSFYLQETHFAALQAQVDEKGESLQLMQAMQVVGYRYDRQEQINIVSQEIQQLSGKILIGGTEFVNRKEAVILKCATGIMEEKRSDNIIEATAMAREVFYSTLENIPVEMEARLKQILRENE